MWYEILPAMGVIFGAMTLAGAAQGFVPWLILGKPGMKRLFHPYEQEYYLRDMELTGSPYWHKGLEGIPDEGETKKSESSK